MSLKKEEAEVQYDPDKTDPGEMAAPVTETGFKAKVKKDKKKGNYTMYAKRLPTLLTLLFLLGTFPPTGLGNIDPLQEKATLVVDLSGSESDLRAVFNQDLEKVRLLLLLSPT